ncbi:[FeFe] hydrogenase H-cluster radical SAM maturase HydE [bacterium]|nr:[FeFe] hydrogenase H-cluster radical SAM maturase HydE [bacterium]MBU1638769.1 [FeFe] hydrogenase H-cluster radical SAM maturase HydE [bacterium]MBU1919285.1 [FeFe] hydrogenase H-cluster radical SAM maturase HydE [bacterium]
MTIYELEYWLRETDSEKLKELWTAADETRKKHVGDEVHLRGLIEISNHCARTCAYCGIRAPNSEVIRYRMSKEEIMECVAEAVKLGYGTVVMQSGEDYGVKQEWLSDIIRAIKQETELAVTLSMGERPREDIAAWREAGADRYLIRFETSDPLLYDRIHPGGANSKWRNRFEILNLLRSLGYETGGGVMIGIPGQSYAMLARDIDMFRKLDLDMIGVGPYIAHPETPLGSGEIASDIDPRDQVPGTEELTCKVVALTRIVRPDSNIPSTTALATVSKETGRINGLMRGANVVMPNLTPEKYRILYDVYPEKACLNETSDACKGCLQNQIDAIGRDIGSGQGGRKR